MNDRWKRLLFQHAIWALWTAVHFAVVPLAAFYVWPPTSEGFPRMTLMLVALSPLYVYLIHRGDLKWKMGGVFSIKDWLDQQRPRTPAAPERVPDRLRPGLALQAIAITTGFAALLAFQSVRFYQDTYRETHSMSPLGTTLIVLAGYLIMACVLNLVQLSLHQLLNQTIWDQDQKRRFRGLLNRFRALAWHFLLAAIIMILLVLPYPLTWICLGVNFTYGILLRWYYFSINIPAGYPNGAP
jgi:hypothetical protein